MNAQPAPPLTQSQPRETLQGALVHDTIVFMVLATAALCIGILLNQFRDKPAPWVYQSKAERLNQSVIGMQSQAAPALSPVPGTPAPAAQPQADVDLPASIALDQFRQIVDQKQILVLDARPEIFHRLGHVPGALALPRDEFDIYYPKLQTILQPKTRQLVLYCSSTSCEDSALVEKALRNLGYTRVSIFHGGWAEWTQNALPEEKQ